MNLDALRFDAATILEALRPWVACESPTWDAAAVGRMMDLAGRDLALLGASVERIPGRMGFGDCLRARLPHPRAGTPGILLLGHMDTVHPVGTLDTLAWRRDGDRCYGPGLFDMKGGNMLMLAALRALQDAAVPTALPVTILFTSDEEVGSPSTRDLIEAEARRHRYVLVPEPARADGGVVVARYAIARYRIATHGRPSHAGAQLAAGASAIREMARQILAIEAMSSDSPTYSVGIVRGGAWSNCVAMQCDAEVLTMARTAADLAQADAAMAGLRAVGEGCRVTVTPGPVRPLWERGNPAGERLYAAARDLAAGLGFVITAQASGGGSDGNFTGALGIPTLDGLGVRGDGAHTLEEHILIDSLPERARLLAGLLATID